LLFSKAMVANYIASLSKYEFIVIMLIVIMLCNVRCSSIANHPKISIIIGLEYSICSSRRHN